MRSFTITMLSLLSGATIALGSAPAAAQDDTPCVTKSQCDLRQDLRDMKDRRDAWNASVKQQEDYRAQSAQLRAQAKADANNGRISRAQQIMHRRHVAAAAAGDNN